MHDSLRYLLDELPLVIFSKMIGELPPIQTDQTSVTNMHRFSFTNIYFRSSIQFQFVFSLVLLLCQAEVRAIPFIF